MEPTAGRDVGLSQARPTRAGKRQTLSCRGAGLRRPPGGWVDSVASRGSLLILPAFSPVRTYAACYDVHQQWALPPLGPARYTIGEGMEDAGD